METLLESRKDNSIEGSVSLGLLDRCLKCFYTRSATNSKVPEEASKQITLQYCDRDHSIHSIYGLIFKNTSEL